jgi:hypothetical protein
MLSDRTVGAAPSHASNEAEEKAMTSFEWLQAIAVIGTLTFVAIQSWLMRRAVGEQRNQLRVQSCLQIWQAHIQTCHFPIATGSRE